MDQPDQDIIRDFVVSMENADSLFASGMDNAGFTVEEEAVDRLREVFLERKSDLNNCGQLFKVLVDTLEVQSKDEDYLPDLIDRLELDQDQMNAFEHAVALAGKTPAVSMMCVSRRRM